MILQSELLTRAGFAHGFSTRLGGVSQGPFASLNLARSVGDDPDAVEENLRLFAGAAGLNPDVLYAVSQVHGSLVHSVERSEAAEEVRSLEADALVASESGVSVSVRTADCMPVLVADPDTGRVAAIHAGWRGVVRGVIPAALAALGIGRSALAAVGPGIGPCCFAVGVDVCASIAAAAHGSRVVVEPEGDGPIRVDLAAAVRAQLSHGGLGAIDVLPACTMCDPLRFFSYRRDGKRSGRMLSAIAVP